MRGPLDQTDPPSLPAVRPLMDNVHRDLVELSVCLLQPLLSFVSCLRAGFGVNTNAVHLQVRNNAEARHRVLQHYKADALCFYGDTYDEEDFE